ncbi:MAG: cell wall-binding repeat-containing protein [Acidimicrobiaceae bacterium]|nr:cell wall-binding repeat-containing protein [Acidimicrobiaceae bacterium]
MVALVVLLGIWPLTPSGAIEPAPDTAEVSADAAVEYRAGDVEIVRYADSDPYGLSVDVAQALVDAQVGSSEWVVLASGESWADAAMAGPLAASLGAPVVLVPPGGLQSTAARPDLVEFLRSAGVRRVVIGGNPDTLPNHEPSVLYGLGMLPRNIERVHGSDPVGATVAVAERIGAPAEFGDLGRTVIIASDRSVADAVAIGPLAAAGPFPLLITAPDALDMRIAAYLADREVAHVVLVGGEAAVAPAVQRTIEAAGLTVTRLAGRDRAETALLAADLFHQHTADDPGCTAGPTRAGLAPARHPELAVMPTEVVDRSGLGMS